MDSNKWSILTGTEIMDGLRNQLFTRACRAGNQHCGATRRDLLNGLEDLAHRCRFANDVLEAVLLVDLFAQVDVFGLDAPAVERPLNDQFEFIEVYRLRDIMIRARLHRLDG